MDFRLNHAAAAASVASPSSSTSSTSAPNSSRSHHHRNNNNNGGITNNNHNQDDNPMHSWWESISRARNSIHALSTILSPSSSSSSSLSSLADSDRPAFSLLSSPDAYAAIKAALSSPASGTGDDSICQWLYDTYQSSDSELRLVVLSFIPLVAGIYLSRIHSFSSSSAAIVPSLAGFEAVLLVLYSSETKSRAGKPILVTIPDLSQPSLYHAPRNPNKPSASISGQSRPSIGVLSAPLEPQIAVKSTKRACIVGVALDCYYKQISQMPSWSKLEFCRFAADWAGQDCPCKSEFDSDSVEEEEIQRRSSGGGIRVSEAEDISNEMGNLQITASSADDENKRGETTRIPLPWEVLQPVLRIVGHCLLGPLNAEEVRNGASMAVRGLYARASHDLAPQAILATRSLIQLDKSRRRRRGGEVVAKAAATNSNSNSNANTPSSKSKKPEILLVSK